MYVCIYIRMHVHTRIHTQTNTHPPTPHTCASAFSEKEQLYTHTHNFLCISIYMCMHIYIRTSVAAVAWAEACSARAWRTFSKVSAQLCFVYNATRILTFEHFDDDPLCLGLQTLFLSLEKHYKYINHRKLFFTQEIIMSQHGYRGMTSMNIIQQEHPKRQDWDIIISYVNNNFLCAG